ncbi:hypothetical protein AO411_2005305 [Salmonella enterica subsp. enterica serovar Sarajane]|nr:hypothetical protein AO411_2005305 [Salmonella enterica subsp. enterica serovar Sarajane]
MKDFRNILRRELKSNVGNTVKGFVGELIEEISFHLEKRGIKSSDADDIARGVVDALRESMGGLSVIFSQTQPERQFGA